MPESPCAHPDIRKFDGIRCCLACGEAVFEVKPPKQLPHTNVQVPYQYIPLNYKLGQEIRLVELLSGGPADPIRCEIIHVNMDDDPEYDAVSYTWATESGDTNLSGLVHCVHGTCIPVTANCDAALRQLRYHKFRRRLWVDSLCER